MTTELALFFSCRHLNFKFRELEGDARTAAKRRHDKAEASPGDTCSREDSRAGGVVKVDDGEGVGSEGSLNAYEACASSFLHS